MSTMMGERKRRYSRGDINNIIVTEQIPREDFTWLCALSTYAMVLDNEQTGGTGLAGMKTACVVVIQSETHPSGYFIEAGQDPVIVINEETSILDYDFISELHPMKDWEIYLWMSEPWAKSDTDFGIYSEWYRRDVYKDGMKPFEGVTRGWEDLPPPTLEYEEGDE